MKTRLAALDHHFRSARLFTRRPQSFGDEGFLMFCALQLFPRIIKLGL